jgi:hypothetical protein
MHLIGTTSTKLCITKLNSFATSSSLIQALNGKWETPIAHLIPRMPFATTIGDSSLEGAGGFSIILGFWWHIRFPDEVVQRTLLDLAG